MECEHVALAILRSKWDVLESFVHGVVERSLESFLQGYPKHFGAVKVEFGPRLNRALDRLEASKGQDPIDLDELWEGLLLESTAVKNALHKGQQESSKSSSFEEFSPEAPSASSQPIREKGRDDGFVERRKDPNRDKSKTLEKSLDKKLRKYTVDLTEQANKGDLDPVLGRDSEMRRVLEVLGRKRRTTLSSLVSLVLVKQQLPKVLP